MTDNTLAEIKAIGDEIAEIERTMQECLSALRQSASEMAENLLNGISDEDEFRRVSSILYWEHRGLIKVATIAQILGISSNMVSHYVYSKPMPFQCPQCQEWWNYYASSQTELDNILKRGVHQSDRICSDCKEKNLQEAIYIATQQQANTPPPLTVTELKTMPYREYLKTEHWKDLRQRALKRASYRCQLCNSNGELHVHHRTYERRGEEWMSDLIVLCADCHQTFHENGQVAR